MKALQYTAYGVRPVVTEIHRPEPGPGEVLVEIAGAALNPLDVKIGHGLVKDFFPVTFPSVVGTDLAGTVVRLGPGVTGPRVGDAVLARTDPTAGGAVAEYAAVPVTHLTAAPPALPLGLAAGLATAAATAWQAVHEVAGLRPGQRVLIHGGAGGVGGFALQLARKAGAHVLTTTSPAGASLAGKLGAHEVIDYTATDFRERASRVDVVIDPIGGDVETASLDVLVPGGLLLALNVPPDADRAAAHGLRAAFVHHETDAARLAKVAAAGLEVVVDRVVPLTDAAAAYDHVAAGHAKGKVVVQRLPAS
ncbi:NADP-dependent oxidoreductase [Nonomuraea sp. NPDC049504]|uniref:NADP-dependent oxidoreductase n=1 Tax=Nonomuraea sp. NPDC049504 TaxID=3154729 RepID=UPI00342D2EE5